MHWKTLKGYSLSTLLLAAAVAHVLLTMLVAAEPVGTFLVFWAKKQAGTYPLAGLYFIHLMFLSPLLLVRAVRAALLALMAQILLLLALLHLAEAAVVSTT
jgi:hypothetical protein